MDPDLNSVAVMIPIVAIGGFFAWMIALAISKAYMEKVRLQGRGSATVGGQEDVLAALEQVRREVAELAERVDFAERLLAKPGAPARKDA
jgi:Na+/citrate or Na+/malate symporter